MCAGSYRVPGERDNILFSEMNIKEDEDQSLRLNPILGNNGKGKAIINGKKLKIKVANIDSNRSGNKTSIQDGQMKEHLATDPSL